MRNWHTITAVIWLIAVAGCSASKDTKPENTPSEVPRAAPPAASSSKLSGVKQRLFADDVPMDSLVLSISIETLGGVSTLVIPRGASLPAEKRETFSTAADNQSSVQIHIVQGERSLAKDNRSLGKFHVTDIRPAERGIPQIEIAFAVDTAGVLDVSAKDLATLKMQKITITESSGRALSKAEVEGMLRDAEAEQAK